MPNERTDPGPDPVTAVPLRQRLRDALPGAMKARDRAAVAVLRATLAAIENAEAVVDEAAPKASAIELSPAGVGAAEVARRALTETQVEQIVRAELAEREAAARDYDQAGRREHAERLRGEAGVLAAHLGPPDATARHEEF